MAPRLSRWIAMTVVAAALVATMFLTTGGTPLLFIGFGELSWDADRKTPLQRRLDGVQRSLARVRARREALELRTLLASALQRTDADPVVFKRTGNTLVADPVLTTRLAPLWAGLPARRQDVRTALVVEVERTGWSEGSAQLDSAGSCVILRPRFRNVEDPLRGTGRGAGECLFAEMFGAPGAGVSAWMRGGRSGLPWDRSQSRNWPLWWRSESTPVAPVWFASGQGDVWGIGRGWRYRPAGRAEMACLVGRSDQCEAATGVGASGWPGLGPTLGSIYLSLPTAGIPRDLLAAIGPERFGQIWASPDPIAVSYRCVMGTPMDPWLRDWAREQVGPIERDNGLSLLGWIGALTWLSLLGLLATQRLKQRAVT